MGTTSRLLIPYPELTDPADVPTDMRELAERLDTIATPAPVTSLPASPADGAEIFYVADAANGVVWHLRYRAASASAYKWEFVGGGGLMSEVVTAETCASASYVDLATVGPQVTVPLGGDYLISGAANISASAAFNGAAAVKLGAAATNNNERLAGIAGAGASDAGISGRSIRRAGIAAGSVLKLQYIAFAGSMNFSLRSLIVVPARVG